MTRRPAPLIVTGGQLWRTTGRLVEQLATPPAGAPWPDVVVWDERDEDGRWDGRPGTFVVRDRPLRARDPRLGALELRVHLWRRRAAPIVLVGRVALESAPWLVHHRGTRTWLPTTDDREALEAGLTIPPAAAGGPHEVLTTELDLLRTGLLRDEPRHRWAPGFRAAAPDAPARPEVLAWGPPDRRQGVDLVGRALAARQDELRALGARVRWIAPPGSAIPDEEADDLRRAGVDDLIVVEPDPDPEQALRSQLEGAAGLLVCGRPGAWTAEETTWWTAFRSGAQVIGFGPPPPPDLVLDGRAGIAPFGDVAAVGAAIVAAVGQTDRLPGPVGLDALVRAASQVVRRG